MALTCNRTRLSAAATGTLCAAALTLTGPAAQAQTADGDHPATRAALETFQANAGPGAAVHAGDGDGTWTLAAGTGTGTLHDGRQAGAVTNVLFQENTPHAELADLMDTALCEGRPQQP